MNLTKVNVCSEKDCGLPIRSRGRCNRHYEAHRRRMMAYGRWESERVPAAPVRAHYEALLAAGMSRNQVSRLSGVKPDQLDNLVRPRKGRGDKPARTVFKRTADRLLALQVPASHEVWRYAADGQRVDPTGTARRLQALVALGWSQRELAHRLGWLESNLSGLVLGDGLVTARTARLVADLFDELQLSPGGSARSRNRAARNGWLPPLAWDEDSIDDPTVGPASGGEEVGADHVTVDRAVAWLLSCPNWNTKSPAHKRWRSERPALTRADRLAAAERLAGELPDWMLTNGLSLRRTDLEQKEGAA